MLRRYVIRIMERRSTKQVGIGSGSYLWNGLGRYSTYVVDDDMHD